MYIYYYKSQKNPQEKPLRRKLDNNKDVYNMLLRVFHWKLVGSCELAISSEDTIKSRSEFFHYTSTARPSPRLFIKNKVISKFARLSLKMWHFLVYNKVRVEIKKPCPAENISILKISDQPESDKYLISSLFL